MTNLLATGFHPMLLLRREIADVIDEVPVPFRMRRDIEILLEQPASPMWLWRAFDQLLEFYMAPVALRRRIERTFERALAASGSFLGTGVWNSPVLGNGLYGNGTFTNGAFTNGAFTNGAFTNGLYANGAFANGLYNNGLYNNGLYNNGAFNNTMFGFGAFGQTGAFGGTIETSVPVEVIEREQDIIVRADLAGVRTHEVDARVTNDNVLTIFVQRPNGLFTRTVSLPRAVDPNRVQAIFQRGILEVSVGKLDVTRFQRSSVNRDASAFRTVSGIA